MALPVAEDNTVAVVGVSVGVVAAVAAVARDLEFCPGGMSRQTVGYNGYT